MQAFRNSLSLGRMTGRGQTKKALGACGTTRIIATPPESLKNQRALTSGEQSAITVRGSESTERLPAIDFTYCAAALPWCCSQLASWPDCWAFRSAQ